MSARETAPPKSLLGGLLGGDLSSYQEQRDRLKRVYDDRRRPSYGYGQPPPPGTY